MNNQSEHDLTRGEMVEMLREFATLFGKILTGTFVVLLIATLNGSQMGG